MAPRTCGISPLKSREKFPEMLNAAGEPIYSQLPLAYFITLPAKAMYRSPSLSLNIKLVLPTIIGSAIGVQKLPS